MAAPGLLARQYACELPLQLSERGGAGARVPKRQRRGARALLEFQSLAAATEPLPSALTWQVAVGTIAGITPFVVAGIEFSKRISAQRKCTVCGGSGLVKRDEYYFRCYSCGGFLPWQSWRRFFSGK